MDQRVQHRFPEGIKGIFRDILPLSRSRVDAHSNAHIAAQEADRTLQHFHQGALNAFAVQETPPCFVHFPHLCARHTGRDDAELGKIGLGVQAEQQDRCEGELPLLLQSGQLIELLRRD